MLKTSHLTAVLAASVLLQAAAISAVGQHRFGVDGKALLCVPDSEMDPLLKSYADEATHLQLDSGRTPGFAFLFRSEVMKSAIPRYVTKAEFDDHPYTNALSGTVGFLNQNDRVRLGSGMRARAVEDEWFAKGACPHPIVTFLPDAELYEVKCNPNADYSAIWNRPPDPKISMPNPNEFVVATCQSRGIGLGPYAGQNLNSCARVAIVEGFLVDYRFQAENVAMIPKMDAFVRGKLVGWKKNCSSPA